MRRSLFIALFLLLFETCAFGADYIVIANSRNPIGDLDRETLREIYLGERLFAGGTRLTPINLTEGAVKDAFLREIVGMEAKAYKLHWIKLVFQQGKSLPRTVGTVDDILDIVRRDRGAVAYIPSSWSSEVEGVDGIMVVEP
ncbi:MAG TPA: hypothetical protein ENJ37_00955 [Deltaproteobacteria bacterium]|nr:hypothetical protein [Deltaproteobacteria bacterium]